MWSHRIEQGGAVGVSLGVDQSVSLLDTCAVWCVLPVQMPPRSPLMNALLNLLKRLLSNEASGSRKRVADPSDSMESWRCPLCTFESPATAMACDMCTNPSA